MTRMDVPDKQDNVYGVSQSGGRISQSHGYKYDDDPFHVYAAGIVTADGTLRDRP
jgi:hypothetical protein